MGFTPANPSWSNGNPVFRSFFALLIYVFWLIANVRFHSTMTAEAGEIGQAVRNNVPEKEPCLIYDNEEKTFSVICDFAWTNTYDEGDFIRLEADEIFNGRDHKINLTGLSPNFWDGLFKISPDVEWDNAPVIQCLHMIGGETSLAGGFIVQAEQNNFIVDSCSSSGTIRGICPSCSGGGGICGQGCSGTILLIDCWSTGLVQGTTAGGITGRRVGSGGGKVNITNCWSQGEINGQFAGGICGAHSGHNGGSVTISKSYSKGMMTGAASGGISGRATAIDSGYVKISECYSLGDISGPDSGGITGQSTGRDSGQVEITNCYSRGDITGPDNPGGICGSKTGYNNGVVIIKNVYASGHIPKNSDAGGIIGEVHSGATEIKIVMSVHNTGPPTGGGATGLPELSRNSNNVSDLNGTVYCYAENECWDTVTVWKAMPHDFPILQAHISPSPSPTPAPSTTKTPRATNRDVSDFPCIDYDRYRLVFKMNCSFALTDNTKRIVLMKHERFEGNGHSIDLTGVTGWHGLFQIAKSNEGGPSSLEDAPVIHDVHLIGGETSPEGGFIVQDEQSNFIVTHCSSSGAMQGVSCNEWSPPCRGGGGICGQKCSGDILISHCWSSGEIRGRTAGGIAGRELGLEGTSNNNVTISHCYSTGNITGDFSGGICGNRLGDSNDGIVTIEKSYSLGEIRGEGSGGITGERLAARAHSVSITNCYSRGDITGPGNAGGICGSHTAWASGRAIITNVYATGQIQNEDAAGLIGHIADSAHEVIVTMSLYNGINGEMIRVNLSPDETTATKNSGDLSNIIGTVYCYDDENQAEDCWNTETVWQAVDADFPILQGMPTPLPSLSPTPTLSASSSPTQTQSSTNTATPTGTLSASPTPTKTPRATNRDVSDFPCIDYDRYRLVFKMNCSFALTDYTKWIVLMKHERFEGNGHSIDLTGVTGWHGLFQIAKSNEGGPSSLEDAPVIHDVHMLGGQTSPKGGFIVQAEQKHFIVRKCSSSGVIEGGANPLHGGGGICGQRCSGDILISHCWSSGKIRGRTAGGIAGRDLGLDGNGHSVNIVHCYSTGDILGRGSGGICSTRAGRGNGHVIITYSYSTGSIAGWESGGICGSVAGDLNGRVIIEQCYTAGKIMGSHSGGIIGNLAANTDGHVSITDCYSRGDITGENHAGGICGPDTGKGTVTLTNVYASGRIVHQDAGGLIGHIRTDADEIKVVMSVYNGETGDMVNLNEATDEVITDEKNSGDLRNITGKVYCYGHGDQQECWDTNSVWQATDGGFPILLALPPAPSTSSTPTGTQTPTPSTLTETATMTPSCTHSPTSTNTMTSTQTGLPTPSLTASVTRTLTSTVSPTSSTSPMETLTSTSTSTMTSSGTRTLTITVSPTPSQSSKEALTSTSTSAMTSSGTRTSTSNASPTSSRPFTETLTSTSTSTRFAASTVISTTATLSTTSETAIMTLSSTRTTSRSGTATLFTTSTASRTMSSTPSHTAETTTTATASPSNVSPKSGPRRISSACGVLRAFDCVTINYEVAVNIVRNTTVIGKAANTKWSNTSTITAQSVDGTVPSFECKCGLDINGRTVNPADCSDQLSAEKHRIPFYAEYEVLANVSCTRRIKTNKCRLFTLVVSIYMIGNHSDSRMRTLDEEQTSTAYAMTMSAVSSKESVLSVRQRINFRDAVLEKVTPIDVSSHPSAFSKTIHRDLDTPKRFNVSIQLAGRSDLRVSWILPPQLLQFIKAPRTIAIDSHLVPPSMAIRDQILEIRTHLLPHGVSTGKIEIEFTTADELVATTFLDLNITVLQGDIRLRQSSIEISQSSTEGPTSRGLLLANEGDKKVFWTSQTFPTQGANGQSNGIAWLSFPPEGSISAKDERSFPLVVSPQLVAGLGVFEAWILIETNSWTGDSQTLEDEFPEMSVPLFSTVDVHFWIRVRFIVSSIFVCQQFSPVTMMLPKEMHVLPLRVINTESSPITVLLSNFSITTAANVSVGSSSKGALTAGNAISIDVEETAVNRVLRLTPWWTIAPSRLALRPGTSGGFRMQIGYFDSKLVPQDLEFEFVLEVFFGGVAKAPEGIVATDFVIAFAPGPASPQTSYMIGNETQGGIGDRINFVVKLLDVFGHGPATALFESERFVSFRRKQLPLLTISSHRLDSSSMNDIVRIDILTGRGVVSEFQFGLDLQAAGEVEIDVKLGNESVTGFPMTIFSETVQCNVNFEVPDSTGTVCLCIAGYYRTETGLCTPCSPGTFLPSASNVRACSLCPKDSFAERGETTCYSCIGGGIECANGIISMKGGYWCEACQQLQFPRVTILELIRRGNYELFHECIPPESCIVNATSFASICAPGYAMEGPICDTCESSFVKVESGECLQCESGFQDLILTIVGASVIVVALVIITVASYRDVMADVMGAPTGSRSGHTRETNGRSGYDNDKHKSSFHRRSTFCSQDGVVKATIANPLHVHAQKEPKPLAKIHDRVLKRNLVSVRHIVLVLVDYFQIAFILHAMEISPFVVNNEWVNHVSTMVTFTPTQAGAVQCTMDSSPFQTSLTIILSPIVVLTCLVIVQLLTTLYQTKCKRPFPWNTWMSSFARSAKLVMNLIHMSVTNATLEVFNVYPIKIDSKERSNIDLTIETSSSQYKLLQRIAVASLIVVVIGYPVITTVYYSKLFSKAKTPEALEQFSRISGGFNINNLGFLWESVVIIRKVALLLVASFVIGPVAQFIWASTTLIVSLFLLAFMLPYKTRFVNYLQYIMILTGLITLTIGFLIKVTLDQKEGLTSQVDALSNVVFVLQIALFLIALIVLVSMASKALKRLHVIVANNLPHCLTRCNRGAHQNKDKRKEEWSITQSPLHDERGTVLPSSKYQDNRLSLHHGNTISFANLVLQTENRDMYKGTNKATGSTRVKRTRKRNVLDNYH